MIKLSKIFYFDQIISTVLIIVYIIVATIQQQHLFNEIIKNNLYTTILGVLIVISFLISGRTNLARFNIRKVSILAIIMIIFALINSLLVRNELLIGVIFNIIICGVIGLRINDFKSEPWLMLIPFWFLVLFIIKQLQIDPNPEHVFLNSRNYISFYLIITVLPYYFIVLKNHKSYSLLPVFITVLLSFYSLGRSGIIASVLILLATLVPRFNKKSLIKILFACISLLFIINIVRSSSLEERGGDRNFDTIESFISDGARGSIIYNYFEMMDLPSFLFGMNTDVALKTILLTYGHVHSSLLNFHSAVGLSGLLFFYMLYLKLKQFFRQNLSLLLLLLSIILRSSTDMGLLFSPFDYVFWMFLFVPIENKQLNNIFKKSY